MQTVLCPTDDASKNTPSLPTGNTDDELQMTLVRQKLTRATHGRIVKLKALVQALTSHHEMHTDELADILLCSESAVRKYIRELQNIQVVVITRYVPHPSSLSGRPVYGLGPNTQRIKAIISWGAIEPARSPKHERPANFIDNCVGRVHILEDDLPHYYRPSKGKHRRDPLVAALFGEAGQTPR